MIHFNDIKPLGWARKELEENMEGCIGHLDLLVPDLIQHDIYHTERLGRNSKLHELGRNDTEEENPEDDQTQFYWWNSETQSNWHDGFCRSAMLLEDPKWVARVRCYLQKVKASCDDGYLGIYAPELRFACAGENGELWAQSTLYRVLTACYEYFREPELLELLTQAVDRLMQGYPIYKSRPFHLEKPFCGVGHGLTVTDTLDWLYRYTGDEKYREYALWLYREYSESWQAERDLQIGSLSDRNYAFQGHGVHTYEHFRALTIAAEADPSLKPLLEQALKKLDCCLTPSGGPIGDEWILGRIADATATGYEFCSLQELLHSYSMLQEKTRDFQWADRMEWLFWNAAQGMKHPEDGSIMYLKTDNCYTADERRSPEETGRNPRYKYSPTHRDAAVCCVPNSGRILPYFLQSTVVEEADGYGIALYNPVMFTGRWDDSEIRICMETDYPKTLTARMEICAEKPTAFDITLRFPQWAKEIKVNGRVYKREDCSDQKIVLRQIWYRDVVEVEFACDICLNKDRNGDFYISRGPLVYALEIPSEQTIIRQYDVPGFCERTYSSTNRNLEALKLDEAGFSRFCYTGSTAKGWEDMTIAAFLQENDKEIACNLRPMARTILRKVTYAPAKKS